MSFAQIVQWDGLALGLGLGLLGLLLGFFILLTMLVIMIQLRKSNSFLEKIGFNMVDIFEILFSNKEHNLKILKIAHQLNSQAEAQQSTLNSMTSALAQLQTSLELQTEALKKINNNLVTMYRNISGRPAPEGQK